MANEIKGTGVYIPEHWLVETLEGVTSKIGSGSTPRGGAAVYESSGVSFVRSQNVHDHEFRQEGLAYISEEIAAGMANVALEKGDVLFNITGDSIMRTTTVPEWVLPARVNQHVAIVRPNGRVLPLFLQKWLSLPVMKSYMLGHSSGGTRKAITKGHLQSFPIPIPPIDEQERIVHFLSAVDDKIESNRRQHNLLESLADALFQKEEKGIVKISDVAEVVMGSSPRGTSYNENGEGVPFYQGVRDFDARYPTLRVWTSEPVRFAQENDTLFSVRAPVGRLNRASEKCCVGRGLAAIRSDYPSTLYYALRSVSSSWDAYEQEGTVFGAINKTDLSNTELNWPSNEHQKALEERLSVIDKKISSLWRENRLLAETRDVLMPDLLSGRVQVSEDGKLIFPQD